MFLIKSFLITAEGHNRGRQGHPTNLNYFSSFPVASFCSFTFSKKIYLHFPNPYLFTDYNLYKHIHYLYKLSVRIGGVFSGVFEGY
jgi:hypothetical protein